MYTDRVNPNFLNVFLKPHIQEKNHWEIEGNFKLTLLNQAAKSDVSNWFTDVVFDQENKLGHGSTSFVWLDHLKNGGFVKNDKILLKVELVAEKLVRSDL